MPRKRHHARVCEWCGEPFMGLKPTSHFCSKRCSTTSRVTPEMRERSRRAMNEIRNRPEVQAKLAAHLASSRNPVKDPEVRAKAHAVLRSQGFPSLTGGNGRGPTEPQRLLAEAMGWPMEHVVPTGRPRSPGLPTHYKLDIAEPSLMVAIEVDGHSHTTARVAAADARKEAFLRSRGWTVLRFSNRSVMTDMPTVLKAITSTTSKREPVTTSRAASWSTTATG